jgi:ubiquinone/menaquinone biosynthesis C-methylase UbiE/acyl carrier protein
VLGTSDLQRELHDIAMSGRRLCVDTPALTAYVRLVDACLEAYPEVLTGRRDHMGVLFPGGSTSLVEGVYVGNDVAETYNRLLAAVVVQYCRTRLAADTSTPLRILEVGAGTGSATGAVLSEIAPFADRVRYVYSDVSASFVKQGRDRFATRYRFTEFATLDLERAPEEQGFPGDSVDLILASNVLHATTRISPALHRVKRLLRTNGVLVLNEGLRQRAYIALTFGLTTGWWHFTDPAYRMQGAPLLSLERWTDLLALCGFHSTAQLGWPGVPMSEWDQGIIVSASNGRNVIPSVRLAPAQSPTQAAPPAPEEPTRDAEVSALAPDGASLEVMIEEYLKGVFHEVLAIDLHEIESHAAFDRYGVDSLVVLEINKRLERDFGKLPASLLFEHMTIAKLGAYFLARHRPKVASMFSAQNGALAPSPQIAAGVSEPDDARDYVDSLSDAEVEAAFAALLKV